MLTRDLLIWTKVHLLTLTLALAACAPPGGSTSTPSEEETAGTDGPSPLPGTPPPQTPAGTWYSLAKPTGSESVAQVQALCTKLGERAHAFGIDRVVVSFEGLGSLDEAAIDRLYEAFDGDPTLDGQTDPGGAASGGYVLHKLIQPLLLAAEGQIEFLFFGEGSVNNDDGSKPQRCIESWILAAPNSKLTLVGHSYGGHAVNQLARSLERGGVAIDSVYTIDARTKRYIGSLGRTANAAKWENYFQTNTAFLNGYRVSGADLNMDLSSTGTSHGAIPGRPEILAAIRSHFGF